MHAAAQEGDCTQLCQFGSRENHTRHPHTSTLKFLRADTVIPPPARPHHKTALSWSASSNNSSLSTISLPSGHDGFHPLDGSIWCTDSQGSFRRARATAADATISTRGAQVRDRPEKGRAQQCWCSLSGSACASTAVTDCSPTNSVRRMGTAGTARTRLSAHCQVLLAIRPFTEARAHRF